MKGASFGHRPVARAKVDNRPVYYPDTTHTHGWNKGTAIMKAPHKRVQEKKAKASVEPKSGKQPY